MQDALVSVIVPVYKVEDYLDKCVKSIVAQTYKKLEIILVDDGSPDNCPAMCDLWAQKDGRIKVIHKPNGGLSSARNAGLDISCGNFVMFVDSDDWIDESTVQSLLAISEDADIIMCGFSIEYEDGTTFQENSGNKKLEGSDILGEFILDNIRPEVCGKLYRLELFSDTRFDETIKYAEDLDMNYRLMKKASKFISTDEGFYHYVRRAGSITSTDMTVGRANLYKITARFVEESRYNSDIYEKSICRHARILFATLSRLLSSDESVSGGKEISGTYSEKIFEEIRKYGKYILKNRYLSIKYKVSVIIVAISPSLFVSFNKLLRR